MYIYYKYNYNEVLIKERLADDYIDVFIDGEVTYFTIRFIIFKHKQYQ